MERNEKKKNNLTFKSIEELLCFQYLPSSFVLMVDVFVQFVECYSIP